MDLAQLVKKWREHAKMTKTELASACFVTDVAVHYWETGKTSPTQANLVKVAEECGAPSMSAFYSGPPAKRSRRARRAS
jgi:transcriptional regulator with XRE-family HTH domain